MARRMATAAMAMAMPTMAPELGDDDEMCVFALPDVELLVAAEAVPLADAVGMHSVLFPDMATMFSSVVGFACQSVNSFLS